MGSSGKPQGSRSPTNTRWYAGFRALIEAEPGLEVVGKAAGEAGAIDRRLPLRLDPGPGGTNR
jgi:hypothetical protein